MGASQIARIPTHKRYRYPSKWAKPFIVWLFRKSIGSGILRLQFADEIIEVGEGQPVCTIAPPTSLRFVWMLLRPDYRLPSQYTNGYWCCEREKLYELLELLTSHKSSALHGWFRRFNKSPIRDHFVYRLFPLKVKEHIAIHYNTSPEFMRLILGETLEYTCAFFEEGMSLEDAQANKIATVVRRLEIEKGQSVLDMGCGWGQIAEVVSTATGARVTGINITPNQIAYAQSNKSANTEFIHTDYEAYQPQRPFDRIYSIGMLEHIGRGKLGNYFHKISQCLKGDGSALVHCIVRAKEGYTNEWIDREVFPGAYIPALAEIVRAVDASSLKLKAIFAYHKSNYYQTLSAWAANLYAHWDELAGILRRLVSDEDAYEILRIWEFYLCGSRLVFNNAIGYCYNVQILMNHQTPYSPPTQSQ